MSSTFKIREHDLDFLVLYILQRHPNIDTTRLKRYIWEYTDPAGINLMPLLNRNDVAIDQIVRNIISHRNDSSNNIINKGFVNYRGGLLSITDDGLAILDDYIKDICFK